MRDERSRASSVQAGETLGLGTVNRAMVLGTRPGGRRVAEVYKVIIWGPGEVGGTALRAILERPEFSVVGCKGYSDARDGVDVGTFAGVDPIGVAATKGSADLIALEADCGVRTPMLAESAFAHQK